jgi:hypothetical protein
VKKANAIEYLAEKTINSLNNIIFIDNEKKNKENTSTSRS